MSLKEYEYFGYDHRVCLVDNSAFGLFVLRHE